MTADEYKRFRDASIDATENMYRQMAYDAEIRGEKRGKTEGIALGEARGKTEGKDEEKLATARRLHDAHASMDIIRTATGFTDKQIKNICL